MPKQQQKKRRNRKPVSCWPCRERKVRCDQGSPCATCWRRDHVHLCKMEHPGSLSAEDSQALYGLPTPKHNSTTERGSQSSSPTYTRQVDVAAAESGNESGYEQLIALLDDISQRLAPTYIMDDITRERIYLGMNCAANFFRELSRHASGKPLLPGDVSIESAFGLTNRTTLHPFGSLWSYAGDVSLGNILQSLPAVEVCLRYYRNFHQNVLPFYPFLLNSEVFESRFCDFLQTMGDAGISTALELAANERTFQDAAWYGVLFGVLACGCQFHDSEVATDRLLKARVFVAAAFECLRLANLFGTPSEATIQTLLMIELTIANDGNPGMAWSLLGTTSQNAQSIGLHANIHTSPEWEAAIHPLWSAIWFLESSLSLAFGRRPSSFVANPDLHKLHVGHGLTFPTFCSWTGGIHKLKLNWQLEQLHDMRPSDIPPSTIASYLQSLDNLEIIPPYGPRSNTKASTIHRRIEQLVSLIHINHLKAEILRIGALSSAVEPATRKEYFDDMKQSLDKLIAAYCTLKPLSATMANSWPIVYATICAALLVSGISQIVKARVPDAVKQLIRALSDDHTFDSSDEDSMRVGRALYADGLKALQHLAET